jgi:hypothetical protein
MFVEGMEVLYRNQRCFVKFICERYIVIRIPNPNKDRHDPLLCIFAEYQKEISILNEK